MGKRTAASKATRGVSKKKIQSSSSNPKTNKFRSQYNSLSVIAKGGPSKKPRSGNVLKKATKGASRRHGVLDTLESIDMIYHDEQPSVSKKSHKNKQEDTVSLESRGTKMTTASFASVWSNCSNQSFNEFFQVWNPSLETHKDALAVIAGLSQTMSNSGTSQSDLEFAKTLYRIISASETPGHILTGSLLALTFVMRRLPNETLVEKFDTFYPILKSLMEANHNCKKKTLVKCLLRCFACLTKAHPLGKEAIESGVRKMINTAIRQFKVQDKIRL